MTSNTVPTRAQGNLKTLAVLIALVLIGTVSLGIFANTIIYLQGDTEPEPSDEALTVTDRELHINNPGSTSVDVSDGIEDDGNPVGYELRLELQRPLDSAAIDLSDLRIDIEGSSAGIFHHVSKNIEHGELNADGTVNGTAVARGVYFLKPVAVETVDATLSDDGDRYELVLPLGVFIDKDGALRRSPTDESRVVQPERKYTDADVTVSIPGSLGPGEGIDNSGTGLVEAGEKLMVTITTPSGNTERVEMNAPIDFDSEAGESVSV